ncbi:MAG: hypothetical protein WC677_08370 [Clostridia bacterium]
MKHKQFNLLFKETILEFIKSQEQKDGIKDIPLRLQSYNDLIDGFHKEGKITDKQAQTWGHPKFLYS